MKNCIVFPILTILLYSSIYSDEFTTLWYDGNAEISTYKLMEKRYGEFRSGTRTMVFVTEPLNLNTLIKPNRPLNNDNEVKVIKLNDLRKFTTGIYEYSLMTSVFSAIDEKFLPFSTMKVSFTAHEWCGNVFEVIKRGSNGFSGSLYSYFESEGEQVYSFKDSDLETEDNLWIKIRELQGKEFNINQTYSLSVLPSSWMRRKRHMPLNPIVITLTKSEPKTINIPMGRFKAHKFVWTYKGNTTIVWVESRYPHKILKWVEADGTWGEILASKRYPYWKLHGNRDELLRKKLHLP